MLILGRGAVGDWFDIPANWASGVQVIGARPIVMDSYTLGADGSAQ
jgi:hypothetical protein